MVIYNVVPKCHDDGYIATATHSVITYNKSLMVVYKRNRGSTKHITTTTLDRIIILELGLWGNKVTTIIIIIPGMMIHRVALVYSGFDIWQVHM